MEFDVAGNVVSVTDPRFKTTTFEFLDTEGTSEYQTMRLRISSRPPTELGTKATYAYPGSLINKINSIASTNPVYAQQVQRGYQILRAIGYQ